MAIANNTWFGINFKKKREFDLPVNPICWSIVLDTGRAFTEPGMLPNNEQEGWETIRKNRTVPTGPTVARVTSAKVRLACKNLAFKSCIC